MLIVPKINIRADEEIEEHTSEFFNEEEYLKAEGIDYYHINVGGNEGYNPEMVGQIAERINDSNGKVMIHCRSAVRATLVWMAWLVRYQDYKIDDAVRLGKMMRYSYPFEELLGFTVKMKK